MLPAKRKLGEIPSVCNCKANLAAIALQSSHGYVVSSAVRQWPEGSWPQGSCWCWLSHINSSCWKVGMLWRSLVNFLLELPYRQWWKSTSWRENLLINLTKGLVSHMNDLPGFSTEKYFLCSRQNSTRSHVTWYRSFAAWTRVCRIPVRPGRPSGYWSVRTIGGFHRPLLWMRRARELVPHGGAKCT